MEKPECFDDLKNLNQYNNTEVKYLFRGQKCSLWKLETSFDREKYSKVPFSEYFKICENLRLSLISTNLELKSKFKQPISNFKDNFLFFAFVQHYGFPTPNLDWSSSLGVASYFACSEDNLEPVIYVLNLPMLKHLRSLHFPLHSVPSILHHDFALDLFPPEIHCARAVAQFSYMSFTNIVDIEHYLYSLEEKMSETNIFPNEKLLTKVNVDYNDLKKNIDKFNFSEETIFPEKKSNYEIKILNKINSHIEKLNSINGNL